MLKRRRPYIYLILTACIALLTCEKPEGLPVTETPDTTSPTVNISSPKGGIVIGTVSLVATANDDQNVQRVEFWIDTTLIYSDFHSPWAYQWDIDSIADNNYHQLTAMVYDGAGNSSTSDPKTILLRPSPVFGSMSDNQGKEYTTVSIGEQVWMAENLAVTHFRDGTAIPYLVSDSLWVNAGESAFCNPEGRVDSVAIYGRLYNWFAVADSHQIAPEGWHVPTDAEWKQLEIYLGMSQQIADGVSNRGTDEGSQLKSTTGWRWGTEGNNISGFAAIPSGYRDSGDLDVGGGEFRGLGHYAYFWTTTENEYDDVYVYNRLLSELATVDRYWSGKRVGFSVRCVKDNP